MHEEAPTPPSDAHRGISASRRTLLKGAAAAGLVWTAPLLQPVTVHATSGVCTRAQFLGNGTEIAPDNNTPLGCTNCYPAGGAYSSTCACTSGWTGAANRTLGTSGVLTNLNPAGGTYTAPSGCTIADVKAVVIDPIVSGGCPPCYEIGNQLSINAAYSVVTFPAAPAGGQYLVVRVLLCCG